MEPAPPVGPRRAFREDIKVEAPNAKTAAFFLAFVPQFVDVSAGHMALQFAGLGIISVTLNTTSDLVVAVIAGRAHSDLGGRPGLVRRLLKAWGGAMVVLGLGLLLARQLSGTIGNMPVGGAETLDIPVRAG